jgi:hypothetical protein
LQVHVSNKLKRNKNRWTPTTTQDALKEFEKERKNGQFKLTSKQKTLARNKNRLTGLPPMPSPASNDDVDAGEEKDMPSSSSSLVSPISSKSSSIRGLEKLAPKPQRKVSLFGIRRNTKREKKKRNDKIDSEQLIYVIIQLYITITRQKDDAKKRPT